MPLEIHITCSRNYTQSCSESRFGCPTKIKQSKFYSEVTVLFLTFIIPFSIIKKINMYFYNIVHILKKAMWRGGEQVLRDGQRQRHGPSHQYVSPEVRNHGGGIRFQAGCHKGVGLRDNGSM